MVRDYRSQLIALLETGNIDLCFANEDEAREIDVYVCLPQYDDARVCQSKQTRNSFRVTWLQQVNLKYNIHTLLINIYLHMLTRCVLILLVGLDMKKATTQIKYKQQRRTYLFFRIAKK